MPMGSRTHRPRRKQNEAPASKFEPTKPGPAYSSNSADQDVWPLITTRINDQNRWVHQSPFLRPEELKGLVIFDGCVTAIEWGVFSSSLSNREYKAAIERIAAEAALRMAQREVRICGQLRKASFEGKKVVFYERHITVWFPNIEGGRKAHVYVGPSDLGMAWGELRIWRRERKPAVVLC
ncbi:hypothetical protein BDZ45DRAFT_692609 [Acephala macrosclerotiorum]|nr:hypothetical protein BDZ45DRAFT_692609 [Acephala macrosclerotiorum]